MQGFPAFTPGTPGGGEQHRQFVKTHGIGTEEGRRKREELTVSIRKKAREESLSKRRQTTEMTANSQEVAQHFQECLQGIYSGDLQTTIKAVEGFRKLLSVEKNPPIYEVIKANVVPRLVEFLLSDNETLQVPFVFLLKIL